MKWILLYAGKANLKFDILQWEFGAILIEILKF